jgi:hypothetical protein
MAMEKIFGRHRAEVKTLAGVYGAAYEGDDDFAAIQADVDAFAEAEGRRPRMLVVKMGQDGHDRGAKVIATAFADIGFDVDVGPLFQTPRKPRKMRSTMMCMWSAFPVRPLATRPWRRSWWKRCARAVRGKYW